MTDGPGSDEPSSLRNQWLTWLLTTVGLALYAGGGEIEARTASAPLVLAPGSETVLDVPRIFANPLQLDLGVRTPGCTARSAADIMTAPIAMPQDGIVRLTPDATARFEVRGGDGAPIIFELMPVTGNCASGLRRLTTNLAIGAGVYRWPPPPETPQFLLEPGFNSLHVKVASVDKAIEGQSTQLYALASVRINGSLPNVSWLWPAIFVDLLFPVTQAIWLLVLLWKTLRARRT
jgi:hypothetical protein